jgi:Transposase IS4
MTAAEILWFLAIYYYMGVVRLPARSDYWRHSCSRSRWYPVHTVVTKMTRYRFEYIWRNLHLSAGGEVSAKDAEEEDEDAEEEDEDDLEDEDWEEGKEGTTVTRLLSILSQTTTMRMTTSTAESSGVTKPNLRTLRRELRRKLSRRVGTQRSR